MTHKELCKMAVKWLKSIGCRVVISEMKSGAQEVPDAIGWRSGISILVECKTSRSDYLADKKKLWRQYPEDGMGQWRYYLCEPGAISAHDSFGDAWGLIHVVEGKSQKIVCPKGNCGWGNPPFESNLYHENLLLVSALSRKNKWVKQK